LQEALHKQYHCSHPPEELARIQELERENMRLSNDNELLLNEMRKISADRPAAVTENDNNWKIAAFEKVNFFLLHIIINL
jgi:hypothetical protein